MELILVSNYNKNWEIPINILNQKSIKLKLTKFFIFTIFIRFLKSTLVLKFFNYLPTKQLLNNTVYLNMNSLLITFLDYSRLK